MNILMICYYWPPAGGPGALRVVKFARYLPQFGCKPVVLTVQKGEFPYIDPSLERDLSERIKIYRTKSWEPFFLYKKIIRRDENDALPVGILTLEKHNVKEKIAAWIRANIFIPDGRIGWIPFAVHEGLKIIKKEKIDLIFTSSPPHSLQLTGFILKKITKLPWIADLRDPWTDIRYYKSIKRYRLIEKVDRIMEKSVLKTADQVTTVTHSFSSLFMSKDNVLNREKISVLPNGYDESDINQIKRKKSSKFRILHTGNLLAHQNPRVLWQSLQQLLQKKSNLKKNLEICFIGNTHKSILDSLRHFGLLPFFKFQSFLPHNLILSEIVNSTVLLVIIPEMKNSASIIPAKLFEYIGTRNPILIIGPQNGDAAEIISRIPNSTICEYQNRLHCMEFIQKIYTAWKKNKYSILRNQRHLDYSRYEITKKLSNFILKHKNENVIT